MGLDMYLCKKHAINDYAKAKEVLENMKNDSNKTIYEEELVGYWRKANHIHKWFVDFVQDGFDNCDEYHVSYDQLRELLSRCERVRTASELVDGKIEQGQQRNEETGEWEPILVDGKRIKDATVAAELLPTQSGFFFGGIDYDEYYMEGINTTIEIIKKLLNEEETGELYYQSWW